MSDAAQVIQRIGTEVSKAENEVVKSARAFLTSNDTTEFVAIAKKDLRVLVRKAEERDHFWLLLNQVHDAVKYKLLEFFQDYPQ